MNVNLKLVNSIMLNKVCTGCPALGGASPI